MLGKRVLSDHVRAGVPGDRDGVAQSNKDRGYVLRRLVRAVGWLAARRLGLPAGWQR